MTDKYMQVRRNTLIAIASKLGTASEILYRLSWPSVMNFVPAPRLDPHNEAGKYDELKKELDLARLHVKNAFELIDQMQDYYDKELGTSSEIFK